jgi:hypothetical protein
MDNYTRIIGATSTNIRTPTTPEINQGNNFGTIFDSSKNNGYNFEMSKQIAAISQEIINYLQDRGVTPDPNNLTQFLTAINADLAALGSSATDLVEGISLLPKQITMSNGTDTDHDIDFTAGNFQFDDGSGQAVLSTPLTKQFDATFALGNNVGGMAEGVTLPTDGTVHVFQISNADGTVADIIGDTDINATNALADSVAVANSLTKKKRLASFVTDGSANIRNGKWTFNRDGSYRFTHDTEVIEISTSGNQARTSLPITCPPLTRVSLELNIVANGASNSSLVIFDKNVNNYSIGVTTNNAFSARNYVDIYTDSNSEIDYAVTGNPNGYTITGLSWFDNNL